MSESRLHPRYEIRVSAEITPQAGHSFTAATRDLSVGGVGLECDRPLADGSTVTLALFIVVDGIEDEATAPLELLGQVAWCRVKSEAVYLAGGQFFEPDAETQSQVQTLIAAAAASASATG